MSPIRAAVALVAAVAGAHLVAALAVHGPIYLPDEYFYTAIARSIAAGGPPTVRGGSFQFVSILGPLLTAPAWLIHTVSVAYRVAQVEGVIAMTLAAFPAFALARRIGLSERGAATAAVLTMVVPDSGYGAFLLSEPFAYPLFLTTLLLALNGLDRASARSEALFLASWSALCLARVQFFFVLPVYLLVAALVRSGGPRRFFRERRLALCSLAAVVVVVVSDASSLVGQYAPLDARHPGVSGLAHWVGLNLLVLFVASGWVIVPGAFVGFAHQLRRGRSIDRSFAALSLLCIAGVVGEAALFGADLDQLTERYTFYGVPVLLLGFLSAVERGRLGTRLHQVLAAGLVALALLLPLDTYLFNGRPDHSPTLLAYSLVAQRFGWRGPLLAGAVLVLLAVVGLGAARLRRPQVIVAAGAALSLALGVGYSFASVRASAGAPASAWRVSTGTGSASYLADSDASTAQGMMMALFWNPGITRVLLLGDHSPDTYPAIRVELEPGGRMVSAHGPVEGAVVTDPAFGLLRAAPGTIARRGAFRLIPNIAGTRFSLVGNGLIDRGRRLSPSGRIVAAATTRSSLVRKTIDLELRQASRHGRTVLELGCSDGFRRRVRIGSATRIALPLDGVGVASCTFSFVGGPLAWWHGHLAPLRVVSLRVRG